MSRKSSEINSSDFNELGSLDDNELIGIFRSGNDTDRSRNAVTVLISRYLGLVRKKAGAFYCNGAESEDLAQEGLLAFMRAVSSFEPERGAKFSSFAAVCVTNGIRSAVMRLSKGSEESLPEDIDETAKDSVTPENIWLEKETISGLYKEMELLLSEKEWSIFKLYLGGASYGEIAERLDVSEKSVDNAVFRVRKKLKKLLSYDKSGS
ncbi:MAG: sigma-70 family RNA polymerase sigma factor [Oscillospiraceae bacterium]|nr:sigma-70 family RNA polymerase sigma factor [Oscillospiraceae bacterium]